MAGSLITMDDEKPAKLQKLDDDEKKIKMVELIQLQQGLKCPRCDSSNTKFCYYNNYSLTQPRHFCKACKRYWTRGGTLRNVPVGGTCRKINKTRSNIRSSTTRPSSSSSSSSVHHDLALIHRNNSSTNPATTSSNLPASTTQMAENPFFNDMNLPSSANTSTSVDLVNLQLLYPNPITRFGSSSSTHDDLGFGLGFSPLVNSVDHHSLLSSYIMSHNNRRPVLFSSSSSALFGQLQPNFSSPDDVSDDHDVMNNIIGMNNIFKTDDDHQEEIQAQAAQNNMSSRLEWNYHPFAGQIRESSDWNTSSSSIAASNWLDPHNNNIIGSN